GDHDPCREGVRARSGRCSRLRVVQEEPRLRIRDEGCEDRVGPPRGRSARGSLGRRRGRRSEQSRRVAAGRAGTHSDNPAMRTTAELREGFLSFFEGKGHLRLPSSSLVPPPEDQSTLLTVAGMQQLKPYLLGLAEPPSRRVTTAQKTFRTVDIENV